MPRVSILVPSYRHGRFLARCLDSVRAQGFSDWELLMRDDGSDDDSVAIAQAYAQRDRRIQVALNDQNLGTYGSLQRALDTARGEYIAVLNSDDAWRGDKLERQVARLDADPALSLCYCLGELVDEADRSLGQDQHAGWPRERVLDALPYLLHENRILASGVLFRRPLRFETTCRYSGDWVALLEAAGRGPFALEPEPLTYWRQHENNTYRRSPRQAREEIRVRESIRLQFLPDTPEKRAGLMRNAVDLWAMWLYFNQRPQACARILEAHRLGFPLAITLRRALAVWDPTNRFRKWTWRQDGSNWSEVDRFVREEGLAFDPIRFQTGA